MSFTRSPIARVPGGCAPNHYRHYSIPRSGHSPPQPFVRRGNSPRVCAFSSLWSRVCGHQYCLGVEYISGILRDCHYWLWELQEKACLNVTGGMSLESLSDWLRKQYPTFGGGSDEHGITVGWHFEPPTERV